MNIENPLFVRESKKKVTEIVCTQERRVKSLLWIDDGDLSVALSVENAAGEFIPMYGIMGLAWTDIIGAYRLHLLFDALPCISSQVVKDAAIVVLSISNDKNKEHVGRIMDALPQGIYSEIMRALPKKLDAVLLQLVQAGMKIDTVALTNEVESGRLPWAPYLADLKVEHPDDRRSRIGRRRDFLAPLLPHFHAYLTHVEEQPELERFCAHLTLLCDMAIQVYEKGVDNPVHLAGIAIVAYCNRECEFDLIRDTVVRAFSCKAPLSFDVVNNMCSNSHQESVRQAARFLSGRFDAPGSNRQHVSMLSTKLNELLDELASKEPVRKL